MAKVLAAVVTVLALGFGALMGLLIAAMLVFFLTVARVQAHDWYPLSCCSNRDCLEVPAGAIKETSTGYIVTMTGEHIPYGDPRVKMTPGDVHNGAESWHWCRHLAGPNKDRTICLYVPGRGI